MELRLKFVFDFGMEQYDEDASARFTMCALKRDLTSSATPCLAMPTLIQQLVRVIVSQPRCPYMALHLMSLKRLYLVLYLTMTIGSNLFERLCDRVASARRRLYQHGRARGSY